MPSIDKPLNLNHVTIDLSFLDNENAPPPPSPLDENSSGYKTDTDYDDMPDLVDEPTPTATIQRNLTNIVKEIVRYHGVNTPETEEILKIKEGVFFQFLKNML